MKIIESPREGMQSLPFTIPTQQKTEFINLLLQAGFDTVEVGSMASPKFIPQLADTLEVLQKLDVSTTRSKLMVLVVSKKGAEIISGIEKVNCISYPYSISPVFLKKNLNVTTSQSLDDVKSIVELCKASNKEAVIYVSMTFGNPYGDEWSLHLLKDHIGKLVATGVRTLPLSNVSIDINEKMIGEVFNALQKEFPGIEFGLHLHTDGKNQGAMIDAAYATGIRRFDAVIHGVGGCPMTGGRMLGNLDTSYLIHHMEKKNINPEINMEIFRKAEGMTTKLFLPQHNQ